jgi:hypothetical protein
MELYGNLNRKSKPKLPKNNVKLVLHDASLVSHQTSYHVIIILSDERSDIVLSCDWSSHVCKSVLSTATGAPAVPERPAYPLHY